MSSADQYKYIKEEEKELRASEVFANVVLRTKGATTVDSGMLETIFRAGYEKGRADEWSRVSKACEDI